MEAELGRYLKTKHFINFHRLDDEINEWFYDNKEVRVLDIKFSDNSALVIYENDKPDLTDLYKAEGSQ